MQPDPKVLDVFEVTVSPAPDLQARSVVVMEPRAVGGVEPDAAPDSVGVSLDDRFDVRINAFLPAQDNHLFNEPDFFRLHAGSGNDIYAQLVRAADSRVCATLGFHESDDRVFASLRRGTFGGLGLNQAVEIQLLDRFLDVVTDRLRDAGARAMEIKCAPFSHDVASVSIASSLLLRRGAIVAGHDLNYDMRIDGRPFVDRVGYGNAKRIRKCRREGFVAETLDRPRYGAAYELIRDNRTRRGYPTSMTSEQLDAMAATFPDRLHYFAVYPDVKRSRMVAAAVCMAITDQVLYVFYWGDAADMGVYSPIALLAASIYEFAQHRGFALLDVGTATVGGVPNHGLVTFKRNLGFSESLKLSFRWRLEQ